MTRQLGEGLPRGPGLPRRRGTSPHDAIAGHLGGPHEVVELPVSHTQLPEKKVWYDFEAYWFRLAVGGRLPRLRREKRPIALEGRAACSARVRASADGAGAAHGHVGRAPVLGG